MTPLVMDGFQEVISHTSVGAGIAAAIAGILILVLGYFVGFRLVKWLVNRMLGVVVAGRAARMPGPRADHWGVGVRRVRSYVGRTEKFINGLPR